MTGASAAPGERLGRYEVVRLLGQGGMGSVFEAVLHGPEGFRKPVALKLLRDDALRGRALLVEEARLGALVGHPNVVVTYDLGEVDGRWYVAMELVRGASLADLLAAGPLPADAVLDAGVQAAAGLAHIHALRVEEREELPVTGGSGPPEGAAGETLWLDGPAVGAPGGVVHRDVKPANLLLDRSGVLKVADLGLARSVAGSGPRGGTPGYLPPEQLDGREGPAADQFALGVTLCELATGRLPFGRDREALERVRDADAVAADPALGQALDACVPGLAAVVRRCLRVRPEERFPDIAALGSALAHLRSRIPEGPGLLDQLVRVRPQFAAERAPSTIGAVEELPLERAPLLGRDALVREVVARLADAPALGLVGLGGVGKSRLAAAVARAARLPGGVCWVALADVSADADALRAVAAGLGAESVGDAALERIGRAGARRGRALLVLDGADRVAGAVGEIAAAVAAAAPQARVLVTSRSPIAGHPHLPVEPLAPAAAAELFARHARGVRADDPLVAELVAELDGIPLAVELAAARTRTVTVAALLARLRAEQGLALLTDGAGRSVAAVLERSLEALGPAASETLADLAVFAGEFGLEDADAVVSGIGVIDALQELVEAGLVRAEGGRFRVPRLVRERARAEDPERRAATARRHGAWFARLAAPAVLEERFGEVVCAAVELRAAADAALARGDLAVAVPCGTAVAHVYRTRGPVRAAVDVLESLFARVTDPADRVGVGLSLAFALRAVGRLTDAEAVLASFGPEVDGLSGVVRTRVLAGRAALALASRDLARAVPLHEAAVALAREAGDPQLLARNLANQALVLRRLDPGAEAGAERLYREALGLLRGKGGRLRPQVEVQYATFLLRAGRSAEAAARLGPALAATDPRVDRDVAGDLHGLLARCLDGLGRVEEATAHAEEALALAEASGDERRMLVSLSELAMIDRSPSRSLAHASRGLALVRPGDEGPEVDLRQAAVDALDRLGRVEEAEAALRALRSHVDGLGDPAVADVHARWLDRRRRPPAAAASGPPAPSPEPPGPAPSGSGPLALPSGPGPSAPGPRRLAAILFTDMIGYSALVRQDEAGAMALLQVHHAIVRERLAAHGGREVRTVGDAFMIEFPSLVVAVTAALDLLRALAEHTARDPARPIRIRAGVHAGDVVPHEGDLYGDAVNLAARLEAAGRPDAVCVTAATWAQVAGKVAAAATPLGVVALKNIGPVELVVLHADGAPAPAPPPARPRRWRVAATLLGAATLAGAAVTAGWPRAEVPLDRGWAELVVEANASGSERTELRQRALWDHDLLDAVTARADRLAAGRAFYTTVESTSETWLAVVDTLREAGLPDVFAAVPYGVVRMVPEAQTSVCAKGLWRMMPETAVRVGRLHPELDFRVEGCALDGDPAQRWTPTETVVPLGPDRIYTRDGACRIPERHGCARDDRADPRRSTAAAAVLLREAWDLPRVRDSGARVQLTFLAHHLGLEDFGSRGALPAFARWTAAHPDVEPSWFLGKNLLCGAQEPADAECGGVLPAWVQRLVVEELAAHLVAVCYFARNEPDRATVAPWRKHRDGYCRRWDVPDRATVAGWPSL